MSVCPYSNEALSQGSTFVGGAPLDLMRAVRGDNAVTWHEDPRTGVGFWAVMRQAEIDYVSKNPLKFSSAEKTVAFQEFTDEEIELQRPILINMDPPGHLKYRQVVRNAFKPKRIDALTERFNEIMDEVMAPILAKNSCEFVTEFSAELPLIAICEILGIPSDHRKQFFEWTNIMLEGDDDAVAAVDNEVRLKAMMDLFAYADTLLEMHRSKGKEAARDDIVSALINAEVEGEALTDEEFRYFIMILVLAGNETTRTASNHGMRLLIENPDQFQLLIDNPDLVDDAVEEILRYNTPVACMRRTAMEDVELAGEKIKAGDKVVMFYQSANHDELVFSEPEKFDVTRQQREEVRNGHRSFGVGEHFCLGSHLARLELQIMFRFIVNHIRNPRYDGDMVWLKSNFINGIKSMPIAYDVVNA